MSTIEEETKTFTMAYDRLVKHYGNGKIALVYGCVERYTYKHGYCWASQTEIGNRIGLTRGTVAKYLKILENDGFIVNATPGKKNVTHHLRTTNKIDELPEFEKKEYPLRSSFSGISSESSIPEKKDDDNFEKKTEVDLKKVTKNDSLEIAEENIIRKELDPKSSTYVLDSAKREAADEFLKRLNIKT